MELQAQQADGTRLLHHDRINRLPLALDDRLRSRGVARLNPCRLIPRVSQTVQTGRPLSAMRSRIGRAGGLCVRKSAAGKGSRTPVGPSDSLRPRAIEGARACLILLWSALLFAFSRPLTFVSSWIVIIDMVNPSSCKRASLAASESAAQQGASPGRACLQELHNEPNDVLLDLGVLRVNELRLRVSACLSCARSSAGAATSRRIVGARARGCAHVLHFT